MSDTIKEFEQLLSEFENVPALPHRDPTFLEICEFPHREVICSNILCFFFNSNREHNLKDLFARSLFELINAKEYGNHHYYCEKEVPTADNKRIDLLLTVNNTAVVIENKIYAKLNNDLQTYFGYISEYKNKYCVVLSLHVIDEEVKQDYKDKDNIDFKFITYKKFFEQIKKNIGFYMEKADKKYLTFLLDFMKNIDNLREGYEVDKDFIEFLKKTEKTEKLADLINRGRMFDEKLIKFTRELKTKMEDKIQSITDTVYLWYPEDPNSEGSPNLWKGVNIEYNLDNYSIEIFAYIDCNGWLFQIYICDNEEYCIDNKYKNQIIAAFAKEEKIKDIKVEINKEKECFDLKLSDSLKNLEANIDDIADTLEKIVKAICKPEFFK